MPLYKVTYEFEAVSDQEASDIWREGYYQEADPQTSWTLLPPAPPLLITEVQVLKLHQILEDVTGLIECNCSIDRCEGTCTYSMAEAMLKQLDKLPLAGPKETK